MRILKARGGQNSMFQFLSPMGQDVLSKKIAKRYFKRKIYNFYMQREILEYLAPVYIEKKIKMHELE